MAVCDVCDSSIRAADGLVLTTTEVAENPRYWEHVFAHSWAYVHEMDPEGTMLQALAERQAAQDSGWLVCFSCARLFAFNPEKAGERATESLHNPQKVYGKAGSPAAVLKAARIAWEGLYGGTAAAKPSANSVGTGVPVVRELPPEVISIGMPDDSGLAPEQKSPPRPTTPPALAQRSAEVPLSAFGVAVKEKAIPKKRRPIRLILVTFGIILALFIGAFLQYLALAGKGHSLLEAAVGFFAQFASAWTDGLWPWIRGLYGR